jgi:hypothetical protein
MRAFSALLALSLQVVPLASSAQPAPAPGADAPAEVMTTKPLPPPDADAAAAPTPAPEPQATPAPAEAEATQVSTESTLDRRETFGAVVGPAVLPSGGSAFYGYVGLPELAAGDRQGFGRFELEGRARLNYLLLSLGAEVIGKVLWVEGGGFEVAPYVGAGLSYNLGTRYFDDANFRFLGWRVLAGAVASYRLVETVRLVALFEAPWDFSLDPSGGGRFTPLLGGGVEIYLGGDVTGLVMAQGGLDTMKEPLGVPATRFGYAVRIGLGMRLF